jgi:hypothetical protein
MFPAEHLIARHQVKKFVLDGLFYGFDDPAKQVRAPSKPRTPPSKPTVPNVEPLGKTLPWWEKYMPEAGTTPLVISSQGKAAWCEP